MTAASNARKARRNNTVKKEETVMNNKVSEQTGKNTSYVAFQKCVDGIIKNFKADNQELEMIAAMVEVQDILSKENVIHLIKGDKLLYVPAKRSNAAKDSATKPSAANQQRGALLELLPHYAAIVAANARKIVSVDSEHKAAVKAAKSGRKLTEKQELALLRNAKLSTVSKNAGKGEAELQIDAIEKMFSRAIAKLYYLRRVSASEVQLNVKAKTITFTGFDFEVNTEGSNTKVKLFASKGEYTKTLAELSRDSRSFLLADGITASRSNGKESKKQTAPTPKADASIQINTSETTAANSKLLAKVFKAQLKDNTQRNANRKAPGTLALFDSIFATLFVIEGKLDVTALQTAVDAAAMKAELPSKVTIGYDNAADVNAAKQTA